MRGSLSTGLRIGIALTATLVSLVGFMVKLPAGLREQDKLLHSLFYFGAALLLNLLFAKRNLLYHCIIFLALYFGGVAIEYAQDYSNTWLQRKIHGRYDPEDVSANLKGLIWFSACWLPIVGIYHLIRAAHSPKESSDFGVTADAREIPVQTATADIKTAYETLAPDYDRLIDEKPHNAYYDRPNTLALLPDVQGKKILDAACGPGKYAELLLSRGAELTGFDLSPSMIEFAKKRTGERGRFFVHDLSQPLVQFPDAGFDGILCALALHYVEDWNPVAREFHRLLAPGGWLVVSIEHPFADYRLYRSENYFRTEAVKGTWRGFGQPVEVPAFRRSLQDCLLPFTNQGFYIDRLVEPLPAAEFEKADPRHFRELNAFPGFLCFRAIKK